MPVHDTEFFVEVPDLANCLYIAFPPITGVENSSPETIEVYTIKVEKGERLSEGEIRNHLYDNFGKQLEYALSVVSGPKEDKTVEKCKLVGFQMWLVCLYWRVKLIYLAMYSIGLFI